MFLVPFLLFSNRSTAQRKKTIGFPSFFPFFFPIVWLSSISLCSRFCMNVIYVCGAMTLPFFCLFFFFPKCYFTFYFLDNSLFGWGLGVGIMYMMSAGKSEISKLNATMDETTKVVEELKTELYRRKSSRTIQVCSSANEVTANSKRISGNNRQLLLSKSINDNGGPQAINVSGLPTVDDGEYPSSVLTEEPEPELLEMDQLEAELECELQKLPWCFTEGSNDEAIRNNPSKVSI